MTHYEPHLDVLPEYADGSLRAEKVFVGQAARALLRLPAEWRQTCEVEVIRRAERTVETQSGGLTVEMVRNHDEARSEVISEILAQLDREQPRG